MKIRAIILSGFKGRSYRIDLTHRDLVIAPNKTGKTAIVQALEFLVRGQLQGMKREEMLPFCTDGRFAVGLEAEKEDGTSFTVTRSFFEKKGGGTGQDLAFDPAGTEKGIAKNQGRLDKEFEANPLVFFNLHDFVTGGEPNRLSTCLELAPKVDEEKGIEQVKKMITHLVVEDAPDAFEEIREEILAFTGPLPTDPIGRLGGFATILDNWAKETRAAVRQKTQSIRELGSMNLADDVTGVNLEAMRDNLEEAKKRVQELKAQQAGDEGRRGLLKDANEKLADLRSAHAMAERNLSVAKETLTKCTTGLKDAEVEVASLQKAEKAHEEADQERVEDVKKALVENEDALAKARVTSSEANEQVIALREKAQRLHGEEMVHAQVEKDLDARHTAMQMTEGVCSLCSQVLTDEYKQGMVDFLQEQIKEAGERGLELASNLEKAQAEYVAAQTAHTESVEEAEKLKEIGAKLKVEEAPVPFNRKRLEAAKTMQERALRTLSRAETDHEKWKAKVEAALQLLREKEKEVTGLATDLPAELEQKVITGAEAEEERLQERVEEIIENRQRFRDQETLRRSLAEQERRLSALDCWRIEVGLKGLQGQLLSQSVGDALEPAQALIRRVFEDTHLHLSWETPSGKPGLQVGFNRGGRFLSWHALSGAEKAILGAALALAFSGVKGPPALLAFECETMDDPTQQRFLEVISDLAGPTALLVTTHHGDGDPGAFVPRELTDAGVIE